MLVIVIGVFMVVYGGIDDSPGGQPLGLLAGIGGPLGIIKGRNPRV